MLNRTQIIDAFEQMLNHRCGNNDPKEGEDNTEPNGWAFPRVHWDHHKWEIPVKNKHKQNNEKLCLKYPYTVMKYEVPPNPRWFPVPKKTVEFVGRTPPKPGPLDQLWCYTWRHWTAEAPDPPNINKNHKYWKRWAMVPSDIHPVLAFETKITYQVPENSLFALLHKRKLEAECENNLLDYTPEV